MKLKALIGGGLAFFTLAGVGCGHPRARSQPTANGEPVLYVSSLTVYFCTVKSCPRDVTTAQMKQAIRRATGSELMAKVSFVSREALRHRHPDGLAGIGRIPPYPHSLTLIPKPKADSLEVTRLFGHGDPRNGIYKVFYYYAFR
jgi:hypothetical protein